MEAGGRDIERELKEKKRHAFDNFSNTCQKKCDSEVWKHWNGA
jgi:hypothetical protein